MSQVTITKDELLSMHNFLSILEMITAKNNGDGVALNFRCDDVKAIQKTMQLIENIVRNDMNSAP